MYFCIMYNWKMKYLYSFHLAKFRYEVGYILVMYIKCGHDIFEDTGHSSGGVCLINKFFSKHF